MRLFVLDTGAGLFSPAFVFPGWLLVGAVLALSSRKRDEGRAELTAVTPEVTHLASPLLTGILLGIGIIGFLDEAVFHQLLQWHTFYWDTDQHGRILVTASSTSSARCFSSGARSASGSAHF